MVAIFRVMNKSISQTQPKTSHKGSITGFILAVLSLVSSGIANLAINAKYSPTGPTTGSLENEAGHAVATGTTSVLGTLFGLPFLVLGIFLGLLSILFVVLRLRKVHAGGLLFSIIAVLLSVWSLSIAFAAFDVIKHN